METKPNDYWLLILNVPIPSEQNIQTLWSQGKLENTQMLTFTMILAHKIVCSDGAINEIKTYFENKTISRGPDFIIGDFDSIDPQSIKWLDDTVTIPK